MGRKDRTQTNRTYYLGSKLRRGLHNKTEAKRNARIKREHISPQRIGPIDNIAAVARMAAALDFAKQVKRFGKWKR